MAPFQERFSFSQTPCYLLNLIYCLHLRRKIELNMLKVEIVTIVATGFSRLAN